MPARRLIGKPFASSRRGRTTTRVRWNWRTPSTALGTLLAQAGHYPEAENNLRAALKLQQALYGASDPTIARTLKDLARAVADGGDLKSAIPLMQRAVAMQRALRGSEPHPDLAEVLNDMGLLL